MSVRWGLLNKFYVSLPASSFLPPSFLLLPLLAGPQQQPLDQGVPRRTSTTNSGSECSMPDLHRKLRIRMFPAGPPPRSECSPPDLNASSGSECSPPTPTKEEIMSKDMLYTYIYIYTYNYIYWNARKNVITHGIYPHISGCFLADVAWHKRFNPKILSMKSTGCGKHVKMRWKWENMSQQPVLGGIKWIGKLTGHMSHTRLCFR